MLKYKCVLAVTWLVVLATTILTWYGRITDGSYWKLLLTVLSAVIVWTITI